MHPSLLALEHRPWPLPTGPWLGRQAWCDLLFAHWPVRAELIREHVPEGLRVQEYDGTAWIGIVPFRMSGVTHRILPPLPGVSEFPELNVRTYVEQGGKPGVWFFSLDATNALAVALGRRLFHLPYHRAQISMPQHPDGLAFDYRSTRRNGLAALDATYAPIGMLPRAAVGSLEHFLTERYCLYAQRPDGKLFRVEVHHVPWPLEGAIAEFRLNTMCQEWRLPLESQPPVLHFARRVDVIAWRPCAIT